MSKHIHIIGICGTFMGSMALLAKEKGFRVSGCDAHVYPPMSTMLAEQGIEVLEGYDPAYLDEDIDEVVIGNAKSRGCPMVERVLNAQMPYTSGAEWIRRELLADRWVLAVAGTHGKTTTASLLTWILDYAGLSPGFLVGGVLENFGYSARMGTGQHFVIEADEYDTAFFDKRSKFVHYAPRTLILNNLEYDHADIFNNIHEIKRQFHHLIRTVPGNGQIIQNGADPELFSVMEMGFWTPVSTFGASGSEWTATMIEDDGSAFDVMRLGEHMGRVEWSLIGEHNVQNALAAIAAAFHVGADAQKIFDAFPEFKNVKRRMELRGTVRDIAVFDDFAHHPTAIKTTLAGLRAKHPEARILAAIDFRSNTMKAGVHQDRIAPALAEADRVYLHKDSHLQWDLEPVQAKLSQPAQVLESVNTIIEAICQDAKPGDQVVLMSNGSFGSIHEKLLEALAVSTTDADQALGW